MSWICISSFHRKTWSCSIWILKLLSMRICWSKRMDLSQPLSRLQNWKKLSHHLPIDSLSSQSIHRSKRLSMRPKPWAQHCFYSCARWIIINSISHNHKSSITSSKSFVSTKDCLRRFGSSPTSKHTPSIFIITRHLQSSLLHLDLASLHHPSRLRKSTSIQRKSDTLWKKRPSKFVKHITWRTKNANSFVSMIIIMFAL